MTETTSQRRYWKIALRVSLVVGSVYTLFMIARHLQAADFIFSDLVFYVGGLSFVTCTIPVFLAAWVLLSLFGQKLGVTSTE